MSNETATPTAAEDRRRMLAELLRKKAAAPKTFPVSFAQQRVWFLAQLDPEGAAYNVEMTLRLKGPLDVPLLERVLRELVARHEGLRTRIATRDGEPVQVVEPSVAWEMERIDLSGLEGDEPHAAVRDHVRASLSTPFALDATPLFRVALLKSSESEHFLSVVFHHAVVDGWSQQILQGEMRALYRAYLAGAPSPLPPVGLQYADFAVWQREQLSGEALAAQLAFWQEALEGAPPAIDLPVDRPRPDAASYAGDALLFHAGREDAYEAMNALLLEEAATPFVGFLALYAAVLSRWSGQTRVVVGTPVLGRSREELEGIVGYFANTLALHVDLTGDPTYRELVRRVRRIMLHAFEHADLPFEKLVEELRVERSLRQNPLYQVMFTYAGMQGGLDRTDADAADAGEVVHDDELRFLPAAVQTSVAQAELSLSTTATRGQFYNKLEYRTELFDAATVERFGKQVEALMLRVVAEPDVPLTRLSLLNDEEREHLLALGTGAPLAVPAGGTVHALFEARAAGTPDAVAIVHRGERVTYAELNARANRIAHHLRALGVGPESLVGVCMERTPDLIAALFGTLKAGGGYVPLDPAYPAERLAVVLEDSGAAVVLTEAKHAASLPGDGVRVVCVDTDAALAARPSGDPAPAATEANTAYVIFTSGSTGRPKGVQVEHRALTSFLHWFRGVMSDEELGGMLGSTSVSFDVSVPEVFGTLCWGGRLVLVENALALPTVAHEDVRVATMVPSAAAELLRMGRIPPSVTAFNLCGEALPAAVAAGLNEVPGVSVVRNFYGPTEDTVYDTLSVVPAGAPKVPIGRPLAERRAYVLDAGMQPSPLGVRGELWLAGAGLARGYFRRPALTAERFVPDPFGPAGSRMYRSGDLARWMADGELEFLGRADHQVKVRGFRIELGEIEAVLRRHPAVADAVVTAREIAGELGLVAYVIAAAGHVAEGEALKAHVRTALPEYMVPSALLVLDAFPTTPNGKLDRRALPAPELAAAVAYVAPRTATETVLAAIWAEVLGRERVGVHDDFFALGGHSLLVTRMASRIRDALGVEVPIRAVFEAPTLAGLAARVDASRPAEAAPPLVPVPRDGPLPASFAQERLWFVDRLVPGSTAYNLPIVLAIPRVPAAVVGRAVAEIVARHEVLRTTFASAGGTLLQVIHPAPADVVEVVDLTGLPADEQEAAVTARVHAEIARPFDLERGPLFRATLLRGGTAEQVLVMAMHHVVSDGWTMGLLTREVEALCRAFTAGEPSPLPPLAVQYADFAVWQRAYLAGDVLASQLGYWRERLAGAPPLLELPLDRPRPPVETNRGAVRYVRIPADLTRALRELSRREGATLFMTLLAGFDALLARWTGQADVVVGSPIAGRTRAEIEPLAGFFVNNLALRTDVSGDPSFRALIARVREVTLGAYAHQDLPFERLVEELKVPRSMAHSPVFQVSFALQNAGGPAPAPGAGDEAELPPPSERPSKYDLSIEFDEVGDWLLGAVEYATDLFDDDTAERFGRQLEALLRRAADAPDAPLSRLEIVSPGERETLVALAAAPAAHPRGEPVHRLVARRAAETPDAVALVHDGGTMTYGELEARATGLAHRLRAAGVGPEVRAGVFLVRSPEAVVALLGVLKAGGTYVPLDPSIPADRTAFVMADAAVRAVVTTPALAGSLPATGAAVLTVAPAAADEADDAAAAAIPAVEPEGAAYVLYTSGSTGVPKGVAVPHGAFAGSVLAMVEATEMSPADRYLLFASLSFDASLEQVAAPLVAGASLAIRGPELWLPEDVPARVEALGLTCAEIPPAYLRHVLDDPARAARLAGRLRFVMVSGEAVAPEVARAWLGAAPGARMLNAYGPTEAAITATVADLRAGADPAPAGTVPIGRQVGERTAHVLDAAGNPAPLCVPGELCVGGPLLARGYHGRPALTAAAFVPDPFSATPGARLYRTGDRVRRRADGALEFFGRLDDQVKVRGFRIELGDVEAALRTLPGVADAVAAVRGEGGDARLVGYVVAAPGAALDAGALRDGAMERLPEYMVPSAVVVLDAVPLTPTGKVDRRALPAPPAAGEGEGHVEPRTETERVLAAIWADVLGVERVGARDHFFELGGHSLLATRVVSRIREALGVELPLRALFEQPTVALLAAWLGDGAGAAPAADARPIPRLGLLRAPASFAQERLWFLDRLAPGGSVYNLTHVMTLRGADPAVLERTLAEVVRRHESLRTTFESADGALAQVIHPAGGFALPVADVAHLPAAGREAEVGRRIAAEIQRGFDLEAGPLFRAALIDAGDAQVLVLVMHHIVSDGWSTNVLQREIVQVYGAFAAGAPSPLPEPALQYADFAVWQREHLAGDALERHLAWWKAHLAGAPPHLDLPTDRPRPPVQTFAGAARTVVLRRRVGAAVGELARGESATPFMVLLAAFSALLARYSGQDDVVVGSPMAGRTRPETEDVIGFFVNTLSLRANVSGDPTFRQLVARVREAALGAFAHQDVPFEKLVEEIGTERSLAHSPLFQVMFSLQNAEGEIGDVDAMESGAEDGAATSAKFDLTLALVEAGGGFAGSLEYNTDLFDAETIVRLGRHFAALVDAATASPDVPLSRLALLDGEERSQVVEGWNDTARPFREDATLHGLFAEQAARTPANVAVAWEGGEMTYAELDTRSTRLAHRLRGLGVGPDVPVAISVDRSPEMVVALLGVLKAGGAYVPVDPAYPRDRREYMLRDCGAPVVLTRASLAADLPETAATVVLLDGDANAVDRDASSTLDVGVSPSNLAYVIYTSGSTGRPKGVMVPHRGVVNLIGAQSEVFGVGETSRVLQFASFSFDAAVMDVFNALLSGAALHLAATDALMPGEPLAATLRDRAITTALIPPSGLAALGEVDLPALTTLISGGEALPADVARRWSAGRTFVNAYGPTEITVCATMAIGEDGARRPAIGRPLPNVRAYVLDAAMRPLPVGIPGELYVGGAGLTRGYLGQAALTAERFVPDPFGAAGDRLYRTGDRVRWLASGELDYLGRLDEQVKVRGFRIELGEIEAVLRAHPAVADAVAAVRVDTAGERRIAAYVVPASPESGIDVGALRAHLAARLADYMVPAAVAVIERVPLTPNGKVDRRALPAPEFRASAAYVAPRTETERRVAEIWGEVLGREGVGAEDDFFELGGHSLLATQVMARIRSVLGVDVPLRALFEAPTVAGLATRVDAAAAAGVSADAAPKLRAVARDAHRRPRPS